MKEPLIKLIFAIIMTIGAAMNNIHFTLIGGFGLLGTILEELRDSITNNQND